MYFIHLFQFEYELKIFIFFTNQIIILFISGLNKQKIIINNLKKKNKINSYISVVFYCVLI